MSQECIHDNMKKVSIIRVPDIADSFFARLAEISRKMRSLTARTVLHLLDIRIQVHVHREVTRELKLTSNDMPVI